VAPDDPRARAENEPRASVTDARAGGEKMLDEHTASSKLLHGLISLAVLLALVVGLVLAVPGLHGVGRTVAHMQLGWVSAAIVFEVLSCLGYVVAFLQVFERVPVRFGARVALTELAFGAAVLLGGAGSVTVGAWMLIERGGPPARVAERSVVLFLLTSAINVITLALTGLALFVGILPGPSNPLLSALPAAVGIGVFFLFLAIPRFVESGAGRRCPGRLRTVLETSVQSIRDTRDLLFKPNWRICGAIIYRGPTSPCSLRALQPPGTRPRSRRSCSPTRSAISPTWSRSRATSEFSTPAWSERSCSTASVQRRPPRPRSSITRSRFGSRRPGARSPTSCSGARETAAHATPDARRAPADAG
jgi:hypothetical protein